MGRRSYYGVAPTDLSDTWRYANIKLEISKHNPDTLAVDAMVDGQFVFFGTWIGDPESPTYDNMSAAMTGITRMRVDIAERELAIPQDVEYRLVLLTEKVEDPYALTWNTLPDVSAMPYYGATVPDTQAGFYQSFDIPIFSYPVYGLFLLGAGETTTDVNFGELRYIYYTANSLPMNIFR